MSPEHPTPEMALQWLQQSRQRDLRNWERLVCWLRAELRRRIGVWLARSPIQPALRGKVDASDLTHEALLPPCPQTLVESFLGNSVRELCAYLEQVARRAVQRAVRFWLMKKRAAAREVPLPESCSGGPVLADSVPSPSEHAGREEAKGKLAEALRDLPDADQRLLRLVWWERRDLRQAAAELGISHEAARARHGRLLKRLRKVLTPGEQR